MDKQVPGKNPGIIWCNSKVTKPKELSNKDFSRWYSDKHLPDVLDTGHVHEGYRYESIDPNAEVPFLALYYARNVEGLAEKLKDVPLVDNVFPGSRHAFDSASFDTRFYQVSQVYERKSAPSTQPDIVLSAEMTPADEAEFEDWYRKEHLHDGSTITGWRRTERYELDDALRTPGAPKYLTLLFVDGSGISDDDMAKAGASEWTQKMMGSMKQLRVTLYRKVSHHKAKL